MAPSECVLLFDLVEVGVQVRGGSCKLSSAKARRSHGGAWGQSVSHRMVVNPAYATFSNERGVIPGLGGLFPLVFSEEICTDTP